MLESTERQSPLLYPKNKVPYCCVSRLVCPTSTDPSTEAVNTIKKKATCVERKFWNRKQFRWIHEIIQSVLNEENAIKTIHATKWCWNWHHTKEFDYECSNDGIDFREENKLQWLWYDVHTNTKIGQKPVKVSITSFNWILCRNLAIKFHTHCSWKKTWGKNRTWCRTTCETLKKNWVL